MRTTGLLCLVVLAGCVDEFSGSNVQFNFSSAMPVQVAAGATATGTALPTNVHYTFYAFEQDTVGRLFAVQDFEIHRIIDLNSPCYIDMGEHVRYPGLQVTQYEKMVDQDTGISDYMNPPASATTEQKELAATAHVRMANMDALASDGMGINAITSASTASYPAADSGCTDTTKIPAPTCTDADSNKRRLAMCQDFWSHHPGFFEGTDSDLTKPLAGTTYGMVKGNNPINGAPIDGSQFFVDEALGGFDAFAVYWQFDDADGDGMPDYPMMFPDSQKATAGQLVLSGKGTMPTRDVMHVHMTNGSVSALTADVAIFANLDQDSTHF